MSGMKRLPSIVISLIIILSMMIFIPSVLAESVVPIKTDISDFSDEEITNNLFDGVFEVGYLNNDGTDRNDFGDDSYVRSKNFIFVEGGRKLCFNSPTYSYLYVVQYDAEKNSIGNGLEGWEREVNRWTKNGIILDERTCYVRFCAITSGELNVFYIENIAEMFADPGDVYISVPHLKSENLESKDPADNPSQSSLFGKKIVYDGDSICFGAYGGGGYAKLIADTVNGTYVNMSKGGARLRTAKGSTDTFHSIVDNLENLPTDGDLYCFQGGINDWWTYGVLGTWDKGNYTEEVDETTVCGALETIFRYCLNNFVGKPICFVITHKIQNTAYKTNANGNTFEEYRDAMVGICQKYSIPYYDAFSESGLNGWNDAQNQPFLTGNPLGEPDGCHPNEEGYWRYYVPQLISLFEGIMPLEKLTGSTVIPNDGVTVTDLFPLGDLNNDSQVNAKDALLVLKISVGNLSSFAQQETAADVNKDGDINAKDALEILKHSVGKPSALDKKQ